LLRRKIEVDRKTRQLSFMGLVAASLMILCFVAPSISAKDPQLPKPPYLKPGEVKRIGIWDVSASDKVTYYRKLGNEYFGIRADSGYSFALVPVSLTNRSKKTDGLVLVTWTLMDDRLYSYEVHTMADMYLSEKHQLNVFDVPPDSTRSGCLVFQVKDGAKNLYLTMSTTRGNATWKLK